MHRTIPRPVAPALALALTLVTGAVAPLHAEEQALTRGPYLQHPTVHGVTVVYEQALDGPGEVRVGLPGGTLDQVFASTASAGRHEVPLTGLEPGTVYEYSVAVGGSVTAPATFSTAPTGPAAFRWVLYGDTRSSTTNHQAVVESILGEGELAFGIQTGDMVADGEVPTQWDSYFDIEQPLMARVPVFPVIGNHDEFDGAATELTERFVAPTNSPMPEHYYSFRYGNAWFTVLDGHVNMLGPEACLFERDLLVVECMTPEQVDWVEGDLAAAAGSGAEHIFVLVHIGPYSSKENRSGSMDVRRLLPLFKAMGVTAVLSGHDHYYERGVSAFGMPYIISGGAGASLYELHEPSAAPHEVFAGESTHHHVLVEVDGPTVTFTARRTDGTVIDTYSLTRPEPECATDADCNAALPPADCAPPATCSVAGRCAFECPVEGLNPFPDRVGAGAETDEADAADAPADVAEATDTDGADEAEASAGPRVDPAAGGGADDENDDEDTVPAPPGPEAAGPGPDRPSEGSTGGAGASGAGSSGCAGGPRGAWWLAMWAALLTLGHAGVVRRRGPVLPGG